jgi:hypothetical protein
MVFNRHCLWRLNPAGTSARDRREVLVPRSTWMCESGRRWTKRSYGRVCRTERFSPKPNPPKPKNPPDGGFLILVGPGGWLRAHLPRALLPLRGAVGDQNAPVVAFCRTSSSNPQLALSQIRKTRRKAGSVVFGRTRRIRTADLYHVKVAL